MSRDNQYRTFEPTGAMIPWLTALMLAGIVLAVVSFGSTWSQLQLLKRIEAAKNKYADLENPAFFEFQQPAETLRRIAERDRVYEELNAEAEASDRRQQMIAIVYIALYIATAVLFLRSLSRANRNARALGANGMTFTPGWCIGWFFVPIANLFKPYQGVKEIWQASGPGNGLWETNPVSPVVGWWWFFWIVSMISGNLQFRLSLHAETLPELKTASTVSLFSDAVTLPLTLVALTMIRKLYAMQETRYESQALHTGDGFNASHATADWKSCRHCGEPVDSMYGSCPMCGEPLGATAADPSQTDNWRW